MSKQIVRLLVERVLRIKEEPKHNMDKTEGKDFEVRLEDLEAKYVETVEKMDETDVDDLEERVDDLEAKHEEEIVEKWMTSNLR
jgi:polyhydroxyalkanoate synthesis regulator phasin